MKRRSSTLRKSERQVRGGLPVRVRSGETPGSLVAEPPCVVERPGVKRGRATVRSATRVKPEQASSRGRRGAGRGGAGAVYGRRRPRKAPGIRERAPRNPPAYWALNGRMVGLGTGESLLGPVACGVAGSEARL